MTDGDENIYPIKIHKVSYSPFVMTLGDQRWQYRYVSVHVDRGVKGTPPFMFYDGEVMFLPPTMRRLRSGKKPWWSFWQ